MKNVSGLNQHFWFSVNIINVLEPWNHKRSFSKFVQAIISVASNKGNIQYKFVRLLLNKNMVRHPNVAVINYISNWQH